MKMSQRIYFWLKVIFWQNSGSTPTLMSALYTMWYYFLDAITLCRLFLIFTLSCMPKMVWCF